MRWCCSSERNPLPELSNHPRSNVRSGPSHPASLVSRYLRATLHDTRFPPTPTPQRSRTPSDRVGHASSAALDLPLAFSSDNLASFSLSPSPEEWARCLASLCAVKTHLQYCDSTHIRHYATRRTEERNRPRSPTSSQRDLRHPVLAEGLSFGDFSARAPCYARNGR